VVPHSVRPVKVIRRRRKIHIHTHTHTAHVPVLTHLFTRADQPPPPPRGIPPPLEDFRPVRGQWLIAYARIDGEQYPYWFNPALLDEAGSPVCTWTLPASAPHTLPASPICTQSAGSAASPAREVPRVETEVKRCDGGGVLHAASRVLIAVFEQEYPNNGVAPSLPCHDGFSITLGCLLFMYSSFRSCMFHVLPPFFDDLYALRSFEPPQTRPPALSEILQGGG
jgi:hypothetical protein